ncbi:MAG: hypothetical protein SH850_30140 [Planctomycetaceae bacterium]|nr:hypothetical protein [Planctomycetaceae bacterium]
MLGHYLAVQAWLRGLDCIAIEREDLEFYLGLKRFKSERIKWLLADITPWFPFNSAFYKSSAASSLHSLFLSRVAIDEWLSTDSLTTVRRIAQIPSNAPKTALLFPEGKNQVTETDVVRYLAVLDSGLASPLENDG